MPDAELLVGSLYAGPRKMGVLCDVPSDIADSGNHVREYMSPQGPAK